MNKTVRLDDYPHTTEVKTMSDGWVWLCVSNASVMTDHQLRELFNTPLQGYELVLVAEDEESDRVPESFTHFYNEVRDGMSVGLFPTQRRRPMMKLKPMNTAHEIHRQMSLAMAFQEVAVIKDYLIRDSINSVSLLAELAEPISHLFDTMYPDGDWVDPFDVWVIDFFEQEIWERCVREEWVEPNKRSPEQQEIDNRAIKAAHEMLKEEQNLPDSERFLGTPAATGQPFYGGSSVGYQDIDPFDALRSSEPAPTPTQYRVRFVADVYFDEGDDFHQRFPKPDHGSRHINDVVDAGAMAYSMKKMLEVSEFDVDFHYSETTDVTQR